MSKKSGWGKFFLGAAIGAGLGILFAPKAGSETRKELAEKMKELYNKAKEMNLKTVVGQCVSSDRFYDDNQNWKLWKKYGAKGIEMESAELYTLAAEFNRKALTILTVSDHILKGTATTAEERQTTFKDMMKLALETIIA